jgi:hypothetical protein
MQRTVTLPIRTVSEANQREHWGKKANRAKKQRTTTYLRLIAAFGKAPKEPPDSITLTRIAPRSLDSDNLAGSFKAIRDGIQDWCGVNDRDLVFVYAQRKGKAKEYAVEITMEWT